MLCALILAITTLHKFLRNDIIYFERLRTHPPTSHIKGVTPSPIQKGPMFVYSHPLSSFTLLVTHGWRPPLSKADIFIAYHRSKLCKHVTQRTSANQGTEQTQIGSVGQGPKLLKRKHEVIKRNQKKKSTKIRTTTTTTAAMRTNCLTCLCVICLLWPMYFFRFVFLSTATIEWNDQNGEQIRITMKYFDTKKRRKNRKTMEFRWNLVTVW